jgi:hypothetical protein
VAEDLDAIYRVGVRIVSIGGLVGVWRAQIVEAAKRVSYYY